MASEREVVGVVGQTLPEPLLVRVTTSNGAALSGVAVQWSANDGGTIGPATSSTDAAGTAAAEWTLGTGAGIQTATATVDGLPPVTFQATAEPDVPAAIMPVGGDGQTALTGEETPEPLAVEVLDAHGNGTPQVEVVWAVIEGGGTVTPMKGRTDATGRASVTWTLGDQVGEQRITATVDGLSPVTFTADAVDSHVARVVIEGTGGALTWLGESRTLDALVLGHSGEELEDFPVSWSSLDGPVASVDGSGEVRAGADGVARIVAKAASVADTAEVVVIFDRPAWRFSVLAGVTRETAEHYGGPEAVTELIHGQLDTVIVRFNRPRSFAGFFEFFLDSVYVFDGPVDGELCDPHPDQDFRVVYDGFPSRGGGWYGSCTTIHHSWPIDSFGGTFASTATDGLAHEFGHARGAVDLYALAVPEPVGNPLNGATYAVATSIMNSPYGVEAWDQHSVNLVNETRDVVSPPPSYITTAFPPSMGVRVVDATGAAVEGAEVELHPVEWYSARVTATAVLSGTTGADGDLVFATNPFGPGDPAAPWRISYPNFLAIVRRDGEDTHAWMPLTAVQNAYFSDSEAPYRLTVKLGSGS